MLWIGLIGLGACSNPNEENTVVRYTSKADRMIREYDLRNLMKDKMYLNEILLYDSVRRTGVWIPQPIPPMPSSAPAYLRARNSMNSYSSDSLVHARMEILEETRRLLFERMENL